MDDYGEYYRRVAPIFDTARLDGKIELSSTVAVIGRFVKQGEGSGAMLDIGCGTGRYCSILNEVGYDVLGVDISPDQLQYAPKSI